MQIPSRDEFPLRGDSQNAHWFDTSRYSVIQRFFLARLERMVALKRSSDTPREPWHVTVLNRAIYSTYRDCVALGLTTEARTVLRGEEGAPHRSASA